MTELNNLQSCLVQLNHISYRLSWVNFLQKEVNDEMQIIHTFNDVRVRNEKLIAQTKMHLDYIFLNLDQLYEIYDKQLGKVLKDIGFVELLKYLKLLWQPIKKLEPKVKLWRNQYVAHGNDQAKKFKIFNEIDPTYQTTIKEIFFVSRLATTYIHTIFSNLEEDYHNSIMLQKLKIKEMGGDWNWADYSQYWDDMENKELDLIEETNKILKKHGYELVFRAFFFGQGEKPPNSKKK